MNDPKFQEQLLVAREGRELEPDFVGFVLEQLKSDKKPDAEMVYGEVGVLPFISLGGGVILDNSNGNLYVTGGGSVGISLGLASGEVCAMRVVAIDKDVDLNASSIMKILTGKSMGVTAYLGAGAGISVPTEGDYKGKVAVIKGGWEPSK